MYAKLSKSFIKHMLNYLAEGTKNSGAKNPTVPPPARIPMMLRDFLPLQRLQQWQLLKIFQTKEVFKGRVGCCFGMFFL